MTAFPNVGIANKWAKQVVSGKIPACKWVKLACKRHLDDLIKSKNKDFPYKFEPKLAEKKIAFIELLPHTKGEWAMKRLSIRLSPGKSLVLVAHLVGFVKKMDIAVSVKAIGRCHVKMASLQLLLVWLLTCLPMMVNLVQRFMRVPLPRNRLGKFLNLHA